MSEPYTHSPHCFAFERNTFAFANELVWEYRLNAGTGQIETVKRTPPPSYTLRCFVLVRSARQFLFNACFDPTQPPLSPELYRPLIRKVVSRSPRQPCRPENRVIIPGYDCLRAFSKAHEAILKAECGGAWQSYVLRSHWRMVFPFSRTNQEATSDSLRWAIAQSRSSIVHVVRFPALTINHGLLLFRCEPMGQDLRFSAYDPNIPERPTELTYSKSKRTFFLPRNHYWAGGQVDVVHIFRNWFF